MKQREPVTPFRASQARDVLEGLVRWLAPKMQRFDGLREAVQSIAGDAELWAELELAREDLPEPTSTPTTPERAPVMTRPIAARPWEHRCRDGRTVLMSATETTCARCGEPRR